MRRATPLLVLALAGPAAAAERPTVQERMVRVALAEARHGVRETPAESNTGRAIRRYHRAVRHARRDEAWCTIFVSFVAKRAGYPLGSVGQGIWAVENLFRWGRSAGLYFPRGKRAPRPGDIAVHGYGHAGVVVRVTKTGRVYTVDGNWGDTVRYQPLPDLSLSGYIRLPSRPRRAWAPADAAATSTPRHCVLGCGA